MNKYLSYGGGVNSTAMMILLNEKKIEFESVFVDHGADYPETYKYVDLLKEKGFPITIIKSGDYNKRIKGLDLTEYCKKYRIMPSRQMRWCTSEFKIIPMYAYFERPCSVLIGFHADEYKRAKPSQDPDITNEFPLIDYDINQQGCVEIIKKANLPVPMKSGCFYCPYQRVGQFRQLRDQRPELYCIAKSIEDDFNERRQDQGKKEFYLKGDMPLDKLVKENQKEIFDEFRKPCQCGQ